MIELINSAMSSFQPANISIATWARVILKKRKIPDEGGQNIFNSQWMSSGDRIMLQTGEERCLEVVNLYDNKIVIHCQKQSFWMDAELARKRCRFEGARTIAMNVISLPLFHVIITLATSCGASSIIMIIYWALKYLSLISSNDLLTMMTMTTKLAWMNNIFL